ncbi:ABC transporter substrate-binding protein [Dactylosporangium fulvum]|uniref:ABC transporter substrate-binding protein n=1 Tax=Dactylosporangium fulvum TaxID=53359 RepID=A0ABY5VRK4_9ACTN|nr:ABC transporter substrate-binding protein [Dactylosporangium fulvum]UWP80403.1 ABC transporter substrate-binding protein [Dactylosporangium fulvum]
MMSSSNWHPSPARRRLVALLGVAALALPVLAACKSNSDSVGDAAAGTITVAKGFDVEVDPRIKGDIRIAHGFGLLYSPVMVLRQMKVLEKKYPNAKIQYFDILTTPQQRDAMLSRTLDFGTATPGPFLQARQAGVQLKMVQVFAGWDGALMVKEGGPSSVLDFIGTTKKISPSLNTAQYNAIQMALKKAGKDPHALDKNFVNLPHPEAIQALMTGSLDAAFLTTDYVMQLEAKGGFKRILSLRETLGGDYYPVGAMALEKTIKEKPELTNAYAVTLRQAVEWITQYPDEAAKVLSEASDGKVSPEEQARYLKSDLLTLRTTNAGFRRQAEILVDLGELKEAPRDPAEIYAYKDQAGENW